MSVLFLGDSITDGWRKDGAAEWARHFAPLSATNLGVWGDDSARVLARIAGGALEGLDPRVTVILIGTNDIPWDPPAAEAGPIPGRVIEAVTRVVVAVRERLPATLILLLGIFPRGETRDFSRVLIRQVNAGLARLPGVQFLDLGDRFLDGDSIGAGLMPDGLHLSAEAYRIWAEVLAPVLAGLLAS